MNAPAELAARILANRLRDASSHGWDSDRCTVEARGFIAELRHQGWAPNPDTAWWPRRRRRTADPTHIAAMAAEAREAIRQARPADTEETTP